MAIGIEYLAEKSGSPKEFSENIRAMRRNVLKGIPDQELQDYLNALDTIQKYDGVQRRLREWGYKVPEALIEELEERGTRSTQ